MARTFLSASEASKLDEELMGNEGQFSVDQLMELAGLAVATGVAKLYPTATFSEVLVLAGPGNNGGDGLVCARHLSHFGYKPSVVYPKPTNNALYKRLMTQCRNLAIPILDSLPATKSGDEKSSKSQVVVDAIFGFSFKSNEPIRAPYGDLIKWLASLPQPSAKSSSPVIPVVSIDIPSGWSPDSGDVLHSGFMPDTLISLTAPKQCAQFFKGRYHVLGGRFLPPAMARRYNLKLPEYPTLSKL
jgi:NAD(P)H-hydrate epimerase